MQLQMGTDWLVRRKTVQSVMTAVAVFFVLMTNFLPSSPAPKESPIILSVGEILLLYALLVAGIVALFTFEFKRHSTFFDRTLQLSIEAAAPVGSGLVKVSLGCLKLASLTGFLEAMTAGYLLFTGSKSEAEIFCALLFSVACFLLFGAHVYAKVRAIYILEKYVLNSLRLMKKIQEEIRSESVGSSWITPRAEGVSPGTGSEER